MIIEKKKNTSYSIYFNLFHFYLLVIYFVLTLIELKTDIKESWLFVLFY